MQSYASDGKYKIWQSGDFLGTFPQFDCQIQETTTFGSVWVQLFRIRLQEIS
jgi:hypothetical protein